MTTQQFNEQLKGVIVIKMILFLLILKLFEDLESNLLLTFFVIFLQVPLACIYDAACTNYRVQQGLRNNWVYTYLASKCSFYVFQEFKSNPT